MAQYYSRNMPTTATYFAPMGQDAFGNLAYAAPVTLKCRWQAKNEMVRSIDGRELVSRAVVYVNNLVEAGGRLALGVVTDPLQGDQIIAVGVSPSLNAQQELVKAWT